MIHRAAVLDGTETRSHTKRTAAEAEPDGVCCTWRSVSTTKRVAYPSCCVHFVCTQAAVKDRHQLLHRQHPRQSARPPTKGQTVDESPTSTLIDNQTTVKLRIYLQPHASELQIRHRRCGESISSNRRRTGARFPPFADLYFAILSACLRRCF